MAEQQTEQVISEQPQPDRDRPEAAHKEPTGRALLVTSLSVLGVVYGDIGTSPLYAFRFCFRGENPVPTTPENILGVLSLIFWSLIVVISVKYLVYVMRADNHGEGGILALLALLDPWRQGKGRRRWLVVILGIFGASLLYGDGMITPAISVLSAIEGLELATPAMVPVVVPITVTILVLLFIFQRRGTGRVGSVFGPVMLFWFSTLAVLGILGIVRRPGVLAAVNPVHGVLFFLKNGWDGFLVLGAVFLVVTGGEALYADMGHFGRRPIRTAWFGLVLPALLLNYFGQGALLLREPQTVVQPFYDLAPRWALYPLVLLATAATVIASQAIISGVFSLTRQAVLLGVLPRVRAVQTSIQKIGQIYIPSVNWMLMTATIVLVVTFQRSSHLEAAYGVAISTTMVITTLLAYVVARERWEWSFLPAAALTVGFLSADLSFFGANILKVKDGGWIPLLVGVSVYTLMTTWKRGRTLLFERTIRTWEPVEGFLKELSRKPPVRVPGTAVFLTGSQNGVPPTLLLQVEHNQVLHEQVILLNVVIENVPRVWLSRRLEVRDLGQGISRMILKYGFMEEPDVPETLRLIKGSRLGFDPDKATYYVGRQRVVSANGRHGMAAWRARVFAFMAHNAAHPTAFYGLPAERVIELGSRVEV